ncbi:MAG TPA: acyl-CoA dehydrogenase family protein [Acidimicrobiales bacterium]|nr:acyl-CoA dehydrogenase family protein [Acidimicrobiales bacterium]
MDLQLTDDQELFRETTARFLESSCPVVTVRELAEKEPAGFERGWWQRGAELGWTSMLVDERHGGGNVSGHGLLDLALVAEEMGRLVSPGPLLPTNVVAAAVNRSGTEAQQAELLAPIVAGERVATWCLAEPGGRFGAAGVTLSARRDGDGFVLDGEKGPVEAAAESDVLLVTARVDGGLTQFLVPLPTPGVSVDPAGSLDLVRRFGVVRFDGVRVPGTAVVGRVGSADEDVERQLQIMVALQCVEMAGAIDRAFEFTVEYSFDRYTFGRALASYQALKHRFADMKLMVEACHATAEGAARAVDSGSDQAAELISVAKSYVGDRAPFVLSECVQMHGGIGVTWDHDLHLYTRRVVQDRSLFGTPEDHRERIATLIEL